MDHEGDCDSCDSEVEDLMSQKVILVCQKQKSDSDSSADKQALQWVEVKNKDLPHSAKNLSTARDNLGK
jgi:hypothetical protein